MSEITDLVNRVYAIAEDGLWVEGTTRTIRPSIRATAIWPAPINSAISRVIGVEP